MDLSSSTSIKPGFPHTFVLQLDKFTQVHTFYRSLQGTGRIIDFIFRFIFSILFQGFSCLIWPFWFGQRVYVVACTGMPIFLVGFYSSTFSWNIYLSILIHSHNSIILLRLLVAKLNTCTSICIWHSHGSSNLTISMIFSSGNTWYISNRGKWWRYFTISFTQQMNSCILDSWVLNKPHWRYLLWFLSDIVSNKWVIRPWIKTF